MKTTLLSTLASLSILALTACEDKTVRTQPATSESPSTLVPSPTPGSMSSEPAMGPGARTDSNTPPTASPDPQAPSTL